MATGKDMLKIVSKWAEFVRPTYQQRPGLLAEMYAWCIAAAHVGLENFVLDQFMVSNVNAGGEGWRDVDDYEGSVCRDWGKDGKASGGGGGGGRIYYISAR